MFRVAVFSVLALVSAPLFAETTQIEGRLTALDAEERTLTIQGKTLEIAKKCEVSINGKPATLAEVPKDESVVVSYDDKFDMVTAVVVGQPTWFFYDFNQSGNQQTDNVQAVSDSEVVFVPVDFKTRGLLLSGQKFGKCNLRFELMSSGDGFVAIAAAPPKREEGGFSGLPFGIEVKLGQNNFGKIVLPPNFEAEMVYGQERKGRDVPPVKQQTPVKNGWNTVEIAVQGNNDVVVKGNGVTLNAIANADSVDGHIVIFAPAAEFRIRNMTIEVDGETKPLSFTSIGVLPSKPTESSSMTGSYDVQWTEVSGNKGTTRYEFRGDGKFLRAGKEAGEWQGKGEEVELRFADPTRGAAVIRTRSPDSFEGTHTKGDGTQSKWKGSRAK